MHFGLLRGSEWADTYVLTSKMMSSTVIKAPCGAQTVHSCGDTGNISSYYMFITASLDSVSAVCPCL